LQSNEKKVIIFVNFYANCCTNFKSPLNNQTLKASVNVNLDHPPQTK